MDANPKPMRADSPDPKFCIYCDVRLFHHNETRDHFHPKEQRRRDGIKTQVYPCCWTCNQIKRDLRFESIEAVRQYIHDECVRIAKRIRTARKGEAARKDAR